MMMENNAAEKQIPAIHAVEGFQPSAFTRMITNDDGTMGIYLDVKYRMLWFRLVYPNGKLETEIQTVTDQYAVVTCKVYTDKADSADQYIAKSAAQRFATQDKYGNRFLENAETAAIGRALAEAGFGTQFCGTVDTSTDLTDAPVETGLSFHEEDGNSGAANRVIHETLGGSYAMQGPKQSMPEAVQSVQAPYYAPQQTQGRQGSFMEQRTPAGQTGVMSLEDAKKVVVDFGRYKGSTLGQIAMINPGDLQWYVDHYAGANQAVKTGATILVNAARQMAG